MRPVNIDYFVKVSYSIGNNVNYFLLSLYLGLCLIQNGLNLANLPNYGVEIFMKLMASIPFYLCLYYNADVCIPYQKLKTKIS